MSKGVLIHNHGANRDFTIVRNEILRDPTLSWKATGLLIYLLSRPSDWRCRLSQLREVKKDGEDSVKSAVSELVEQGYVFIEDERDERGRMLGKIWHVFDQPRANKAIQPEVDFPRMENPHLENPPVEDPPLPRTDFTKNRFYQEPPPVKLRETDIEKFVEAAIWGEQQAGRTVGPNFKHYKYNRILKDGATAADFTTLEAFQKHMRQQQDRFKLPELPEVPVGERYERQRQQMRAALGRYTG